MCSEPHRASRETLLAERSFACVPESVAAARRWAKTLYASAQGADPDACELLVSEVATNAVQHTAGAEFKVRIFASCWIEIWDGSYTVPQRRQATEESTGGRGLEIMELLAPGYEIVLGRHGKAVRFLPKGW